MTPLPPAVRALFTAPFKTDRELAGLSRSIFLYDATLDVVASRHVLTGLAIPRGYGRHQYLPNGDARHDAWCAWFHENVPESATLDEAADVLNRAWSAAP